MQDDKHLPPEAPPSYGFSTAMPQNYPPPDYSQHGYPQQTYPTQAYPQSSNPAQGYVPNYGPTPQGYGPTPPQGFGPTPAQGFGPISAQGFGPTPAQSYGPTPAQGFGPTPAQGYGPTSPPSYGPSAPQPTSNNTVLVAPSRPSGCFKRGQTNRPQTHVLSAATLIFISGGINLAWSIGFRYKFYSHLSGHVRVAWFIGAIIGAAISNFLPKIVPKKVITLFCSMLVMISGIINASSSFNIQALTASHYLNGIANGLVFAPTLVLAGEIAVSYMRGKISASTEQLSFNVGIFLQILISTTWGPNHVSDINPEQIQGIISALFGFMGLCFATLLFIESPVYLLIYRREQEAIDALQRLQRPFTLNSQTIAQLDEHKLYVSENEQLTTEQSFVQASPVLIKLCTLRALNAMSISAYISYALKISLNNPADYYATTHWPIVIFGACRLLGSFLTSFFIDSVGRKTPTLVGLVVCSALAIVISSQFSYQFYSIGRFIMFYFFQFFAGMAFTASSAYISEAYPLMVKQNFISFTYIIELLVFIIIGTCDALRPEEYLYTLGGIYLAICILAFWFLPETRRTTLRESQKRFRSLC